VAPDLGTGGPSAVTRLTASYYGASLG